jgi:hypothetical protein
MRTYNLFFIPKDKENPNDALFFRQKDVDAYKSQVRCFKSKIYRVVLEFVSQMPLQALIHRNGQTRLSQSIAANAIHNRRLFIKVDEEYHSENIIEQRIFSEFPNYRNNNLQLSCSFEDMNDILKDPNKGIFDNILSRFVIFIM